MNEASGTPLLPSFLLPESTLLVDPKLIATFLFWIAVCVWGIYSLVATYHWFRYGHRSPITIPVLLVHVAVSGMLLAFAASSFL
ncbi:MAG: hypothetical protein WAV21_00845 [Minisyncoccia bacterium]